MRSLRPTRREAISVAASGAVFTMLGLPRIAFSAASTTAEQDGTQWHDVREWGIEGRGWNDTARYFDRLPAKAEAMVRPAVWNLSRHSAGMCVRFATDSAVIRAGYSLLSSNLAMPHMAATGVSGLDLYAADEAGRMRWVAVAQPTRQEVEITLAANLRPGRREYALYLPLYNGVESLQVGVAPGTAFEPIPPRQTGLLAYYGTSIAHGACAGRPGMAFPASLGRRLGLPHVNLGFSGNGKMEPELADLLAELDAAVYCIDCLPNLTAPEIEERAETFVKKLRGARPNVPIVLIEDRTYGNSWILPERRSRNDTSRAAFRAAYRRLLEAGVTGLEYVEGEHLLGDDDEATIDGSHPSDLGMMRMADTLEPVLRRVLKLPA
ncbi:SGNH/GDSL hydrolase family protein [Thermopirellula anaerolimosa]